MMNFFRILSNADKWFNSKNNMKTLAELKKSQNNILILHYACTDITKSPVIISSISIKDFSTIQILSFSFDEHKNEKNLLSEFVKHMKKYQNYIIVTWNQKSSTYGIQHIKRRCKELGITENFPIDLEQITDLDYIFTEKYGRNYVNNPKLRRLAEVNSITLNHFVDGIKEIHLFEEKEYKKIENSTNRKVNVIADYLSSAFDNKLKISKQSISKDIRLGEISEKNYDELLLNLNKKQFEVDDVIEPFKLSALERISKIVGDYFTGFEITELFKKSGYSEIVHDGSTKWKFLYSTFENIQKRKFGSHIILKFLETTCDPQEYFEKPESHITILHKLNSVLSFYGMEINEKGKVIKIKEKRNTVAITSKNDPESSYSKPFGPKEIRKAKEDTIPRMVVNPNYVTPLHNPPPSISLLSGNPHKKRDFTIAAIIISVVVTFVFSPYFSDFISPPTPEIHVTDLNALDGIVEGSSPIYSYEPRTLIPNGTKNEIFFLTISNSGGVHAKNFWIDIYEKPDGQWFDFHTSAIVHSGTTKNCQNKSSLCTIELIPKETGSIELQYSISFDHKLYQEIVDETPKLFFKYGFDDTEEQVIEIFLKFD